MCAGDVCDAAAPPPRACALLQIGVDERLELLARCAALAARTCVAAAGVAGGGADDGVPTVRVRDVSMGALAVSAGARLLAATAAEAAGALPDDVAALRRAAGALAGARGVPDPVRAMARAVATAALPPQRATPPRRAVFAAAAVAALAVLAVVVAAAAAPAWGRGSAGVCAAMLAVGAAVWHRAWGRGSARGAAGALWRALGVDAGGAAACALPADEDALPDVGRVGAAAGGGRASSAADGAGDDVVDAGAAAAGAPCDADAPSVAWVAAAVAAARGGGPVRVPVPADLVGTMRELGAIAGALPPDIAADVHAKLEFAERIAGGGGEGAVEQKGV